MINILVTGSKGQLGSELKTVSANYNEYTFYFTTKNELNISNYKEIDTFIVKNNINVLINCAAYTNVDKAEEELILANEINYLAVKNIAKIAKKNKVKLIHISTDYVFDGTSKIPYLENSLTNPINKYGTSKLLGEKAILKTNPKNAIIIRTSWLYSSFGHNFVKTILKLSKERKEITVINNQFGSPTYANDLAVVILKIIPQIKNKNVEIYHFSNLGECSWFQFSEEIIKLSKSSCVVKPILSKEYKTKAKRPEYSLLNNQKIQKDFNVVIQNWKDSLKKCIDKIK